LLKITIEKTGAALRLKLDGKLSGPWVAELEKAWSELAEAARNGSTIVDLTEVTHIDAEGRRLLAEMHQQGAKLRGCGIMIRDIIEQIELSARASKTKPD